MENKNTFIVIALSAILSAACTAAALKLSSGSELNQHKDVSSIKSQIEKLERMLRLETEARVSLENQLSSIQTSSTEMQNSSINSLVTPPSKQTDEVPGQQQDTEADQESAVERFREQRRAQRLARQQPGYRQQQLISAGFATEEAARIVQIESEESLRQLQAQYDSRREFAASADNQLTNTNSIRAELGDQNYERYLEANGLPTSARIGSVIGGSPGQSAGLQAGDNITSYAGERVFNLSEINNLTVRGTIGESVLIEVDRAGESIQLTIPRGPIGISNRGRGRFSR